MNELSSFDQPTTTISEADLRKYLRASQTDLSPEARERIRGKVINAMQNEVVVNTVVEMAGLPGFDTSDDPEIKLNEQMLRDLLPVTVIPLDSKPKIDVGDIWPLQNPTDQ